MPTGGIPTGVIPVDPVGGQPSGLQPAKSGGEPTGGGKPSNGIPKGLDQALKPIADAIGNALGNMLKMPRTPKQMAPRTTQEPKIPKAKGSQTRNIYLGC